MSEYTEQAERFLKGNGLRLRATFKGDRPPPWSEGHDHGDRYLITISRKGQAGRISFSFWNSINASAKGEEPTAYDVLACISSDSNCPDTFHEFCGEYGYDEDSISALRTYKRLRKFAKKLTTFLSAEELEQLGEIQ